MRWHVQAAETDAHQPNGLSQGRPTGFSGGGSATRPLGAANLERWAVTDQSRTMLIGFFWVILALEYPGQLILVLRGQKLGFFRANGPQGSGGCGG